MMRVRDGTQVQPGVTATPGKLVVVPAARCPVSGVRCPVSGSSFGTCWTKLHLDGLFLDALTETVVPQNVGEVPGFVDDLL